MGRLIQIWDCAAERGNSKNESKAKAYHEIIEVPPNAVWGVVKFWRREVKVLEEGFSESECVEGGDGEIEKVGRGCEVFGW